MSSRVALVRCDSYDTQAVYKAVGVGLELLGGVGRFASMGETIVLKPNLLVGSEPESCVTTHPAVFEAVVRHLQDTGAHVQYGDSPGFGRGEGAARKAGLGEVADAHNVPFADFAEGRQVSFPEGHLIKQWVIANGVLEADGLISLPKFKTHGLTRTTGAIKNQFGCVPGVLKGEFHARMPDVQRFAQMLVDLNRYLRPRLYVMDGIIAMEGNGPRSGDPRPMNALLISEDPVALDATMCRMMNLDPELVDTIVFGEELGLGVHSDVEIVGEELAPFIAEDYDVNRSHGSTTGPSWLASFMKNWVTPKPIIREAQCTSCGTCVKVCPVDPKAVDWDTPDGAKSGRPPVHDYTKCIRCYCCQELCPERAIEVDTPLLGRMIHRGSPRVAD